MKVMSSIRSREILPAVQDAISQVSGDPSPYVKKAAAFAIVKAAELAEDESETEVYLPILERLLADQNPIAFSGAIAAYWSLCPDNVEMLHPHFRYMCQNMRKFDPWAQVFALRSLTVYARYCFKNPSAEGEDESTAAFWDDSPQKDTISADLLLLISTAKKMLMSPNAAVVMAAVALIFYCGPSSQISVVARPLVRLLYDSQITAQLALAVIITIASQYGHIFIPHMSHFFVRRNDLNAVKKLKLKVLSLLASPANADQVLNELSMYTGSNDTDFAASAVKTMGRMAMGNEDIIPTVLVHLLRLMGRSDGQVLAEVVLVIAHILRKRRRTDDEAHALKKLCRKFLEIKDPSARAAVLSIVGDMHDTHPEFAPQLLRHIARNFGEEPAEVRLQALTLAAKICATVTESKVPLYVLKLGERDGEFDVRDRARFLAALVEAKSPLIAEKLRALLFPERKAPTWTAAETYGAEFQIGTVSHFLGRAVVGYEPMPDWADPETLPPDSVRMPASTLAGPAPTSYDADSDGEANAGGEDNGLEGFFSDGDEPSDRSYYEADEEEEEGEFEEGGDAPADDAEDDDDFFN